MSADIRIDHAEVRRAAAGLRASVVSNSSGYSSIDACGNPLVAATVDLFVSHFVASLDELDGDTARAAEAILETADEFAGIESAYAEALRTLAGSVDELMPDE